MSELDPLRIGRVTASRVSDVMAKGKGGEPSRTRASYMAELICEKLTGLQYEGFQSADMLRGNEIEAEAKRLYSFVKDVELAPGGFHIHHSIEGFGASPDSLVGDGGLAEFKCPKTSTHVDTLLGAPIDRAYICQMQAQMVCTGRSWCDFVSFDPRMPADMQLFVRRVYLDRVFVSAMEDEIRSFLFDMAEKIEALNAQYSTPKVA